MAASGSYEMPSVFLDEFDRFANLHPIAPISELDDAELHFAGFGDHGLVPWGVPDELHGGFVYAGEGLDLGLGLLGEYGTHAASGGGEGHLDGDLCAAICGGGDLAIVDEAEVDDVYGDLGVVAGFQLIPDFFFVDGAFGMEGIPGAAGLDVDAEGVGVLRGDACEAHLGGYGVAAAEGLGDEDGAAGWEDDGIAGGDLDGGAVAGECALGVFVHDFKEGVAGLLGRDVQLKRRFCFSHRFTQICADFMRVGFSAFPGYSPSLRKGDPLILEPLPVLAGTEMVSIDSSIPGY
jgi:hypothetical protein